MRMCLQNGNNENTTKFIRHTKNLNKSAFLHDLDLKLSKLNLSDPNLSGNTKFNCFHRVFKEVVDLHIPLRPCTRKDLKRQENPWITNGILKSINTKNKLYFRNLKHKTPENERLYKRHRNLTNHIIKRAKCM